MPGGEQKEARHGWGGLRRPCSRGLKHRKAREQGGDMKQAKILCCAGWACHPTCRRRPQREAGVCSDHAGHALQQHLVAGGRRRLGPHAHGRRQRCLQQGTALGMGSAVGGKKMRDQTLCNDLLGPAGPAFAWAWHQEGAPRPPRTCVTIMQGISQGSLAWSITWTAGRRSGRRGVAETPRSLSLRLRTGRREASRADRQAQPSAGRDVPALHQLEAPCAAPGHTVFARSVAKPASKRAK